MNLNIDLTLLKLLEKKTNTNQRGSRWSWPTLALAYWGKFFFFFKKKINTWKKLWVMPSEHLGWSDLEEVLSGFRPWCGFQGISSFLCGSWPLRHSLDEQCSVTVAVDASLLWQHLQLPGVFDVVNISGQIRKMLEPFSYVFIRFTERCLNHFPMCSSDSLLFINEAVKCSKSLLTSLICVSSS